MSNQSSASGEKPPTIQDILREIERKSEGGGYIYRGERKHNPKISSKLYREFEIETENFDVELVQKEMLAAAKKHIGHHPQDFRLDGTTLLNVEGKSTEEAIDFEILADIQHYGGRTNLIDFTTDYFIALFFACDGRYDVDGRVILKKTDEMRDMITHPRNPRHRVIAQKSVFIRPPRGFIEPREEEIVTIQADLKQSLLKYLRDYHGISTEAIYNDLHGFIRSQDIHGDAYTHFYRGFACQNKEYKVTTPEAKQEEYEKSIEHFNKAIALKPDYAKAYNNRGVVYVNKSEFESAIKDFDKAIAFNPNFAEAYRSRGNAYRNKGKFENAIKDYNKAIALNLDYAEVHNNRGIAYGKMGNLENAIQDFDKAIAFNPNYAKAYNNRGFTYAKKGEIENAIQDYNKAIALNPDGAVAYYNRGGAWLHLTEWKKATSDLTTARNMGLDIINAFCNDYTSVEDFEQKTGIQLPEDIAEMLTR